MLEARDTVTKKLMTCRALSPPVLTYCFRNGFMVGLVEIKQLDFKLTDVLYEH
jgi:hypothetical protein